MTTRIGKPDTAADVGLRSCLEQKPLSSFIMVAGAGSGKTTSLVKALDYLGHTRGADLRRRGQQIACITYTDTAVGEIWGDVGNAPLFHISTIHSFIWKIVHPFQQDLREWIVARIDEKAADAKDKISKPRTQQKTRDRLIRDIDRLNSSRNDIFHLPRITYGTGSDYAKGILGHDDILKVGPALITDRPLLCALIAQKFPFIFIDESQDTSPSLVAALKTVAETVSDNFCLGFFGDPMQKIYTAGVGAIPADQSWNHITKTENFRCPMSVLAVINQIRAEDDGLVQIGGRMISHDGKREPVMGTARMFVLPADHRRNERLVKVRKWLAKENSDPLWESDSKEGDIRILVLVHRMAAKRLGFADLYAALNDNGPSSLKEGLLDGTAWVLAPFLKYLLPLARASQAGKDFDVVAALRANCPLLSKERLGNCNIVELLARLKSDVAYLVEMLNEKQGCTIRDVLVYVHQREIALLDDRFSCFLAAVVASQSENDEENTTPESVSIAAFLNCPAKQLWGYLTYVDEQSPFSTHQGIKGAEFQRVIVVLDDEEGDYNLFSYSKLFGIAPLSDADAKNIAEGKDSVIGRTRRLFYVCCSRAVQDLAVVMFVSDVRAATDAIVAKGFFPPESVHMLES